MFYEIRSANCSPLHCLCFSHICCCRCCPPPRVCPSPPLCLLHPLGCPISAPLSCGSTMDGFSDLSFSMTLTRIQGSERLYVKTWETGFLVKKKKNEIQHSCPEGSNDAQLLYCLVKVRHFREYILSFNEPTAEGPGFISAARILSLFQVPITFLYFHLSLFQGCVYLKCLSLSLQLVSSF